MAKILPFTFFILVFAKSGLSGFCQSDKNFQQVPFSTDNNYLTIWNGEKYVPFFIKGVNLGVSLPGTTPGELPATYDDYMRWFGMIKEAGFNCIRVYTLHYPRFYQALRDYNLAHPKNPLYVIHGTWLDEDLDPPAVYFKDLDQLTPIFYQTIEENIDCIHGNRSIPQRYGRAWGDYTADISPWVLAAIIGREVYPQEILTTNANHPNWPTVFNGNYLKIYNATPSEYWFVKAMEYYINYEWTNYQTMRPISISSWPTLDPLKHPGEIFPDEDTASLDLSKVVDDAYPAGIFISYHAYPYYPYFVSYQDDYQVFFDYMGPNSYLGYLTALKAKYQNHPLIIAEFGVPSSWVVAKYASSGMNHGGADEFLQGIFNLRMLANIRASNCGGGIMFAWIDEWFKRTWIADPLDYLPDRRPMWLNEMSPEQNFGLVRFDKDPAPFVPWSQFTNPGAKIYRVSASATYKDFRFVIVPTLPFSEMDTIYIGIDTYDDMRGEFLFPTGHTSNSGNEFLLKITNAGAELFVTPAYDLYGIWHGISPPSSLYHSVLSIGGGWNLVRIKNNEPDYSIQYIGNLKMNYCGHFPSSTDAVIFCADSVVVNLPWNLIHFVDPSQKRVFHDYRSTWQVEDTISNGIRLNILYKNQINTTSRYLWDNWQAPTTYTENIKTSYTIIKNGLSQFNTRPVAVPDIYNTPVNTNVVRNTNNGPLANDFDLDGNYLACALQTMPSNGTILLTPDGNMIYSPNPGFMGTDHFRYIIFDGQSWSEPASVFVNVGVVGLEDNEKGHLLLFPNPAQDYVLVKAPEKILSFSLWNADGRLVYQGSGFPTSDTENVYKFDLSELKPGTYILHGVSEFSFFTRRLTVL